MADPMKIRATLQGDVADVRILMRHPMETGQRKNAKGDLVPVHFIQSVVVAHNSKTVLDAQWSQTVSRDPFLGLRVKGAKAGDKITATWTDNKGDKRSKYPASGKLAGDWKVGAKLVASGAGMRIRGGRVEKAKENGALCINCHALDPREVNVGNLGPSLTGYGAQRGATDATVKYTYEKIYNAWTYFPCSNMPRLGAKGYLTPEQIAHVVAYLVDPQSPVNRR